MDYIILGGDERFASLARLLEDRGEEVARFRAWSEGAPSAREAVSSANNVVLNYPVRFKGAPSYEELTAMIAPDAALWLCGPGAPEGEDDRIVNLFGDEALLRENAYLTAEGALCAAMNAARRSLRDLPALVIGWGRIGRALTDLLVALDVPVAVASRQERHRCQAAERGAEAGSTADLAAILPGRKLVFNTAPFMTLDDPALVSADREALLIDLASAPYGIDLGAAWKRGLRAWREPGLPGRYCPDSAAEALLHAMDRAREGRNGAWLR